MSTKGKRLRTEFVEVRGLASPSAHPRVGFIVPRYRQTAVARNRLKRRLREIVRTRWLRTLPAMDLVVRALPEAYRVPFDVLEADLTALEQRLRRFGARP